VVQVSRLTTFEALVEHGADLDQLDWEPNEDRMFSFDLLRIALRHGVPSKHGIVLDAQYALDLGRSDQLRIGQQQVDELQAQTRATSGPLMESLIPGWTESGIELDARSRESAERIAAEADADLADVLAAPVKPELADHWRRLGGQIPA
jgi:hypothetical protein